MSLTPSPTEAAVVVAEVMVPAEIAAQIARNRKFESISLQRGVMYEPALTLFAMTSRTRFGQVCPGRADRKPHHRRNVEGPPNDRFQLPEAPALTEGAAVLHRCKRRIVKPLRRVAAGCRR